MNQDLFNESELDQLQNATKVYYFVKSLLTYSEELDNQELFLPAINEIKDSYDHLMRVFGVKFGFNDGDQKYIDVNLGKTYSHMYRALYDLLDYTMILQRKLIYSKIKDFSPDTLATIYPRYYQEILPDIGKLSNKIPSIKENKDIGNPNIKDIEEYIELIEKLKVHIIDIDMIMPSLLTYERDKKEKEREKENKETKTRKADHKFDAFIAIISVLLGLLGGYLLGSH